MFDISKIATPHAIDVLDYEEILQSRKNKFLELLTVEQATIFAERLNYESEPILKLLEENAYLELLLRQKINNNYKAVLLAFAKSTDLDALAVNYGVTRKLLEPANLNSNPPKLAVFEDDEDLRKRCFLSFESLTNAGTIESYKFHTLNADSQVKDCFISSPNPCEIKIYLLSNLGDGTASSNLCLKVKNYLNQEDKRPLGDRLEVVSCQIVNIDLSLTIYITDINFIEQIKEQATLKIKEVFKNLKLGHDLNHSLIINACMLENVHNVKISNPPADKVLNNSQIARLNNLTLNVQISER